MTCLRGNLIAVLIATAATAQTQENLRSCTTVRADAGISELVMEGIVPMDKMVRPNGALPVGSDIKTMIETGKMEIRLRVEYQESARTMRLTEYLAGPSDPFPNIEQPSERSGSVLQMMEVSTEAPQTASRRIETFALVGTVLHQPVAWLGNGLSPETPVSLLLRFVRGSSTDIEHATVAWPGGATTAVGAVGKIQQSIVRTTLERSQVCGAIAQAEIAAPCCASGPPPQASVAAVLLPSR